MQVSAELIEKIYLLSFTTALLFHEPHCGSIFRNWGWFNHYPGYVFMLVSNRDTRPMGLHLLIFLNFLNFLNSFGGRV